MRDASGLLVGWGVGTATFPALMMQAEARATLRADGSALVEIGACDMGQGAWTALAQIAADGLGLDLAQVEFRSGTSDLPNGGIAGGGGVEGGAAAVLGGVLHPQQGRPQCARAGGRALLAALGVAHAPRRPRHPLQPRHGLVQEVGRFPASTLPS